MLTNAFKTKVIFVEALTSIRSNFLNSKKSEDKINDLYKANTTPGENVTFGANLHKGL